MVRKNNGIGSPKPCPASVSIDALTKSILDRYADQIQSKHIRIETELQHLTADVFPKFIYSAVCKLIELAIDATPDGGELNVTLIDGENCWELEVADSSISNSLGNIGSSDVIRNIQQNPVNVATERAKLEIARRAAIVHGGKIQSWNCPQGGTANVLVIPRRQETRKAA